MATKPKHLDFEKPLTTVDVVIFSVLDEQLQVLLIKRPTGPQEPFRMPGPCPAASWT